jgi:hypothetical protein
VEAPTPQQRPAADVAVVDRFLSATDAPLVSYRALRRRVGIRPKRRAPMLVEGSIFLTESDADLVRVEGSLVKRPSFWTRRVDVVRRYARIAGVRIPISMTARADVLLVGQSSFSMDYQYLEINGQAVESAAAANSGVRLQ